MIYKENNLSSKHHASCPFKVIRENIGPLWRRKYYVIPPQGLRNITSSLEAHNNRNVNHHSVITIDNDVTLNCQKLWWRL